MLERKLDQRGRIAPLVGIAFGGGGIKAAAHGGVMKVFEEYNIPVDLVAGTSAGAAYASLYAYGYRSQHISELFQGVSPDYLMKVRLRRNGLIDGRRYEKLIRVCTDNGDIEDLSMPLAIVAVDLISAQKVVFTEGNISRAVRASSGVPGVIAPIKYQEMLLADGFLLDNCPDGVLYDMGADLVIAIDLSFEVEVEPQGFHEVIARSMEIMAQNCQQSSADYVLKPMTQHVTFLDKKMFNQCREWGEECARKHIEEIIRLIEAKTVDLNKRSE
ncbi:MAG: patatin-like phospholipase family protein [Bacillota bacterium]|jgi:NTE family protein